MTRTMTVKGNGSASLPPDFITITMTLIARDEVYESTIQKASIQLKQLRECLLSLGFLKEDLKTTSFTVDTEYENVRDKDGNYNRVFIGYICRQTLSLGFEIDNALLGKVINRLSSCEATPEFTITYELKDDTLLKDILLKNAVNNATHRAHVLADSANVLLGKIRSIDYSWDTIQFQRKEFVLSESVMNYSAPMLDIQPDDISASDSVTVVWDIN